MPSNLSSLTNKKYAKKFIDGADRDAAKHDAPVEEPEKLVRLNVDIPESLRQELKKFAVSENTTVRKLVLSALESSVKKLNKKHTDPSH